MLATGSQAGSSVTHHLKRLPARNNSVFLWDNGTERCVVKKYAEQQWSPRLAKYRFFDLFRLPGPIEFQSPARRRKFESETFEIWKTHGFKAPQELSPPQGFSGTEVIAQEYIEAPTLAEHLTRSTYNDREVKPTIKLLLVGMRRRHERAIASNEHRLIHYDPNPRNILMSAPVPTYIDFEAARLGERIEKSASREVYKFSLEILFLLERGWIPELAKLVHEAYGISEVVKEIEIRHQPRLAKLKRFIRGTHRQADPNGRRAIAEQFLTSLVDYRKAVKHG